MPQPSSRPSPLLIELTTQLSAAARGLRSASANVIALADKEGFRYPALLEHILRNLERDFDDLYLLLQPERLNDAEDLTGRHDPEATTAAQAST